MNVILTVGSLDSQSLHKTVEEAKTEYKDYVLECNLYDNVPECGYISGNRRDYLCETKVLRNGNYRAVFVEM